MAQPALIAMTVSGATGNFFTDNAGDPRVGSVGGEVANTDRAGAVASPLTNNCFNVAVAMQPVKTRQHKRVSLCRSEPAAPLGAAASKNLARTSTAQEAMTTSAATFTRLVCSLR